MLEKPVPDLDARNVYYMLSYALRIFDLAGPSDIQENNLEGLEQVLAELLLHGIDVQRKRGLQKDYVSRNENLSAVRGKLHVRTSCLNFARGNSKVNCSFEEYSVDTFLNQVLKLVLEKMLRVSGLTSEQKIRAKKLLPYFSGVSSIPLSSVRWENMTLDRNTSSYRLIINVAYLFLMGLGIESSDDGKPARGLEVRGMHLLYQKFVYQYVKYHYPSLVVKYEREIKSDRDRCEWPWQIPKLNADIVIEDRGKKRLLVIDTKYYGKILTENRFGGSRLQPGHRNQIFTYALHLRAETGFQVDGLLLYAQTNTDDVEDVNFSWTDLGTRFASKTLNLGSDFNEVTDSLDAIVSSYFPGVVRSP